MKYADFVTRVNDFCCMKSNHKVENLRCEIKIFNKSKVEVHEIPGAYCRLCDKYYILEKDYFDLKEKGNFLCQIVKKEY